MSQNEITDRLSDTLGQTRDELEEAKKLNMTLKQKLDETNKKFDENVSKIKFITSNFFIE
jgi:hypothetical protein